MVLYIFTLPTVGVTMTLQHLDDEFHFTTPTTYLLLTNPPNLLLAKNLSSIFTNI